MRTVARAYSTPLPAVLDMEWLEIVSHAYAAPYGEFSDKLFQMKLAGAKVRI